jgi:hypothetical protein
VESVPAERADEARLETRWRSSADRFTVIAMAGACRYIAALRLALHARGRGFLGMASTDKPSR